MSVFTAHYRSLNASAQRTRGLFDFESSARFGSKANAHDARVKMLELFGNDALTWQIDTIERKAKAQSKGEADGQLELDFRAPVAQERKRKRSTKRGIV